MLSDHLLSYFSAIMNNFFDLGIDLSLQFLTVGLSVLNLWESNVPDFFVHTKFRHNLVG